MKKILTLIGLMIIVACSVMAMTSCDNTDWGEGDGDPSLLEYKLSEDGTYYIVAGIGDYVGTHLVIPEEHNGLPVKEIALDAFYCEAEADEPQERINAILGIRAVTFPDSITEMGWTVFRGSNIEQIKFGSGLTEFYEYSFFLQMYKIKEINVSKDNQTYMTKDGVLYSKDGKRLILYPVQKTGEKFRIPNHVETISAAAFMNSSVKKVKMSNRVTIIEEVAFAETSLEKIKIGNGVEVIEEGAFRNCASLKKVNMGKNVRAIGEDAFLETKIEKIKIGNKVETIGDYAFMGTSIKEIKIPDSVKNIGESAFRDCTKLKNVKLGRGLTEIPLGMFYGCESLKKIFIPINIEKITGLAFVMCDNLTEVFYEGNDKQWNEVYLDMYIHFGIRPEAKYCPVFDESSTLYCYSKDRPSGEGNYWRYVFWNPTVWKK